PRQRLLSDRRSIVRQARKERPERQHHALRRPGGPRREQDERRVIRLGGGGLCGYAVGRWLKWRASIAGEQRGRLEKIQHGLALGGRQRAVETGRGCSGRPGGEQVGKERRTGAMRDG